MNTPIKRTLAAMLSADVAGYSRLMGADEEGTLRPLAAHRAVVDSIIGFHNGRVVTLYYFDPSMCRGPNAPYGTIVIDR